MSADAREGAALELTSAGDVEQLVRARGTLFAVTNRHGDIAPRGAKELGVFFHDTRYLSYYELLVDNAQVVHLSQETKPDAFNQIDLMLSGLDEGEFLDDPQNYLHIRRRQLLDDGFAEEIAFTNFLQRPVTLRVRLAYDADFADIFEVRGAKRPRRGALREPQIERDRVTFAYRGLDGIDYSTSVAFEPAPASIGPRQAMFEVHVEPRETSTLVVSVTPGRWHATELKASFRRSVERLSADAEAFREASTRVRCDDGFVTHLLAQATKDLHALRISFGEHRIVAAGIPWFCCPFGRDSIVASYEALMLNAELATETLRTLAAYQGTKTDEHTEEEPGKIFHELRFGEMVRTGEMPHRPYYGSVDATPLFVILADATYRMTGDEAVARALLPAVCRALEWIDRRSEHGTRFVTYEKRSSRGLDNQGWKDSKAGVSYPDGRRAQPPIALVEVQGYCVDAYLRGARLLRAMGQVEEAAAYAERGERMRALVDEVFWLPQSGRYAFAIDGTGGKLDTVVSNVGHLLWSRVPSDERAKRTAELLTTGASFSGYGVRTLAQGQPVYNPLSYHNGTVWPHDNALVAKGMANYRLTSMATAVFEGLVAAAWHFRDRRLPELFCGISREKSSLVRYPVACSPQAWASAAPFLLLQAILGMDADGAGRRLSIRNPTLPPSIKRIELENLRVGASRVCIRFRRVGTRCHVDRLDVAGAPLRTEIDLD